MFSEVDHGLANPENPAGRAPALQFQHTFETPFLNLAQAFVTKFNWESRASLTSVSDVQQLDDDRIVFYRRHEAADLKTPVWEQVIMNRQNQSIESSRVIRNPNGSTYTISRDVIRPDWVSNSPTSTLDSYIYDVQGNGVSKVEMFKFNIGKLYKAMQFRQFEQEWKQAIAGSSLLLFKTHKVQHNFL